MLKKLWLLFLLPLIFLIALNIYTAKEIRETGREIAEWEKQIPLLSLEKEEAEQKKEELLRTMEQLSEENVKLREKDKIWIEQIEILQEYLH